MPYLTKDIIGSASRMTFGKKGDKVTIFSDHDNVLIVESDTGFRYSVNRSDLSDSKVDRDVEKTTEVRKKKR